MCKTTGVDSFHLKLSHGQVTIGGVQVAAVDAGTNKFINPGLTTGSYTVVVTVDGYPPSTGTLVTIVAGTTVTMATVVFP